MKLVLIIPPSPWLMSDRDQPMMGALYIASFIKAWHHEVQLVDLSSLPEEHWHLPIGDIYGITGVTPQYWYMQKIIHRLKEREPDCTVVAGGVHATVLPNHLLEQTKVDYVVTGEGEYSMLRIMVAIESKNPLEKGIIKGVQVDLLDNLPFPDRESLDYYEYMKPQTYAYLKDNVKEGSIITSRGCPHRCAYCASNKIWGRTVRYRSPENVYTELRYLKDRFDIGLCNFVDDTFILNKKRIYKICELIKPLGIKWFFLTRVDHVDYELFLELKKAGAISVTFGFESGSNRMLKFLNKNTTVEQAYNAIRIAKRVGLEIRGQMMVGLPSETEEDVELTADFIRKTKKDVTKFGIHVFQPIPGCDIWENPEKYNYWVNKKTEFLDYHTIGKTDLHIKDDNIKRHWNYLREVAGVKNIDK
jgi:radical SAM superfamily enzyme YgiQ (UPF0313 family)